MCAKDIRPKKRFETFEAFKICLEAFKQKYNLNLNGRSTKKLKQEDIDVGYRKELQFRELIYVCETYDKKKKY